MAEEKKKKCRVCGVEKNLTAFYRGSCKDGRSSVCKVCDDKRREHNRQLNIESDLKQKREYYRQHKESLVRQQKLYYSTHKNEESNRKKKYYKNCKAQILKRQKRYRQENRETYQAYQKKYYKENQERELKRSRAYYRTEKGFLLSKLKVHRRYIRIKASGATTDLSLEQWQKIIEMQKGKCTICGKKFTKHRAPTIDHIISIFHGGGLTSDNLQALCKSCNSSKHTKLNPQFIQTWNHNTLTRKKSSSNEKSL